MVKSIQAFVCRNWGTSLQLVSCMRFVPGTSQTQGRIVNDFTVAWYMTVSVPIQYTSIRNIPLMRCQFETRKRCCHQGLWCQLAEHCTAQMLPSATPGQHIHQLGTSVLGSALCWPSMPATWHDARYGRSDILLLQWIVTIKKTHVHTYKPQFTELNNLQISKRTGRFSRQQTLWLVNVTIFQLDAIYSVYYISVGSSTCFGCWHPSSGACTTTNIH